MTAFVNRHSIAVILLLVALIIVLPVRSMACTQEEALNKMMAIGRAQTRLINQPDDASQMRVVKLATEVASVGQVLADKKYDEACRRYDEIAAKFDIDLKAESTGMVTIQDIKKDGGKRGGVCSQSDAHKRMMDYFGQIDDRIANRDEGQLTATRFRNDTTSLNEIMYTDPSEVCRRLDGLKEKYHLK